jgi:hypothetical protein
MASRNPVFPELYKVFGAEPPGRWSPATERGLDGFKQHFGRPRTIPNIILLPWDMTMHAARYGGTLGPLLLAFLPMGLVAARSGRARALAAGAVLVGAVWASPLSSYQLRFLVPAWIALAPLIAAGMQVMIVAAGRSWKIAVQTAFSCLLLVNLPPWTPLHEGDREGWSGWLTHVIREPPAAVVLGGISEDEWLRSGIRSYAAWQWIDTGTPVDSKVLTFFGGDHLYTHRARLWSESAIARRVTWDAAQLRTDIPAALRELGITYMLAPSDEQKTEDLKRLEILQPRTVARLFEPVYTDRWTVVYRLRDGSASPGTSDQR